MVGFLLLALSWLQPEPRGEADLVLRGGKVITVGARDTIASAVAVRGNRIAAVGADEEISRWIGPRTEVVELSGRALLPGFIDAAHTHVDGTAENEHFRVQIQSPPLSGPEEILAKLADLVVSSGDPLSVSPDRLLDLRAEVTIVDGKIAFRR